MTLGQDIIVGCSINNTLGITGKSYDLKQLLKAAREAEAMGYDAVWVHDGMTGRRTTASFDPTNVLTAVAAQTTRIHLCTGILIPHIRNPIHVAQQWATLWDISEGRAIMGAGTGAGKNTIYKRQFDALAAVRGDQAGDFDPARLFDRRAALFDECLDVINRLWLEDKFPYHGRFYRFNEVTLGIARPAEKPPILVGGGIYIPAEGVGAHHYTWNPDVAGTFMMGPKITRTIAEQGDGWLFVHATHDELNAKWAEVTDLAKDRTQYPPRAIGANFFTNCNDDADAAWRGVQDQLTDFHGPPAGRDKTHDDLVDRWAAAGSGRQIADKLNGYIDAGVTVFQLVIASPDQMGMMRKIAEDVLPHIKRSPAAKR